MNEPKTPTGLRAAGKKLWQSSTAEFELAQHELALLEEACRTRDYIRDLDKAVRDDGVMIPSSQGSRLHPAIAESRQQRLALARMLVTLQIPGLDDDLPPAGRVRPASGARRG
ncbi:terminase [Pseudarthrobacter sp. BIM B-2242]|uniref:terminase n=1 Tax=Pseudarthrobacter sp. BIM B-2242 TaxID=2772401 RepID=UPI001CC4F3F3|nr:terminase [Pseudarthrobacter sp. BIM B-2242]